MKDKSKKLLVINTNKKPSSTQSSGGKPSGGGFGGVAIGMSDYLLKAVWDRVFELKTDKSGAEYLFSKLPLATQYGITMYADGGELDLPSIFAGLPFDNQTIWLNPETGVIEVIGGTGGGSGEGVSNFWDLSGIPSWITITKPKYSYSEIEGTPDLSGYASKNEIPSLDGYATEDWVTGKNYVDGVFLASELKKYVTIDGDETINGLKNFTKGLQIGGLPLTKLQDDVAYLDAHLVVRGGITMFGTGEDVDVPTIMDALSVDGVNLQVINGVLTFVGEATGGVADSVRWENVIGRPTLLSSFTDDVVKGKYLPLNTSTTNILTSSQSGVLNFKSTSTSEVGLRLYFGETNGGGLWYNGVQGMYLYNAASATQLGLLNDGTPYYHDLNGNKRHLWHSGNFNPANYLPLSGGTISGTETLPITISNNINDGNFNVGIRLLNPNKTNTNGNTHGTAQFGYSKSNGVYMFNYDNYNYYNCAIGITDYGIAYVGKGGLVDTKYKIWHEGNDGSGSGLDADLLDGKHNGELSAIYLTHTGISDANTFGNLGAVSYCNTISPSLSNIPSETNSWQQAILSIGLHSTSNLQAQFYMSRGHNLYYRSDRNGGWGKLAFTTDNVASATKLQTARTIWGQSFDGTGNIDGDLKFGGNYCIKNPLGAGVFHPYNDYTIVGYDNCPNEKDTYIDGYKVHFRTHKSWEERLLIDETGNVGISVPITPLREFTLSTLRSKSHFRLHHNNIFGVYMMVDYNSGAFAIQSGYQNQAKALDIILQPRGGKIGIGTLAPSCSLHVVGDILSTGGITMYSDQRKKTILNHVELSLSQIADAPLIEHYYNSDESKTTHVGSIAQYWAGLNDWFCKKDNEGFYTMEIQNAALASAISIARELVKYESKTDKKIRLLKKRIGELEEEIEKLKRA